MLSELLKLKDPLLKFRWKVSNLPFGIESIYVEKVSIPFDEYESIPVYNSGANNFYTSTVSISTLSFTLYENKDLLIYTKLYQWRKLMYDQGYYGLPSDYKKDLVVELIANNQDTVIGSFTVLGGWPSSIASLDLDQAASERVSIEVTLTLDNIQFFPFKNYGDTGTLTFGSLGTSSSSSLTATTPLLHVLDDTSNGTLQGYSATVTKAKPSTSSITYTPPEDSISYTLPTSTPPEPSVVADTLLPTTSTTFSFSADAANLFLGSKL